MKGKGERQRLSKGGNRGKCEFAIGTDQCGIDRLIMKWQLQRKRGICNGSNSVERQSRRSRREDMYCICLFCLTENRDKAEEGSDPKRYWTTDEGLAENEVPTKAEYRPLVAEEVPTRLDEFKGRLGKGSRKEQGHRLARVCRWGVKFRLSVCCPRLRSLGMVMVVKFWLFVTFFDVGESRQGCAGSGLAGNKVPTKAEYRPLVAEEVPTRLDEFKGRPGKGSRKEQGHRLARVCRWGVKFRLSVCCPRLRSLGMVMVVKFWLFVTFFDVGESRQGCAGSVLGWVGCGS
ncbi:hypothetical protein Droror1_Dr00017314 [Drosera rotundifolia]